MLKIEYLKTVYLKSEDSKYAFVLGALYFTRQYGIFGKNLRNVKQCEITLLRYSEYLGIYALMASLASLGMNFRSEVDHGCSLAH